MGKSYEDDATAKCEVCDADVPAHQVEECMACGYWRLCPECAADHMCVAEEVVAPDEEQGHVDPWGGDEGAAFR